MSKYHAIPTERDGIRFASRKEADHYSKLELLQRHGYIRDLRLQVRYPLVVNGVKVAIYIADFVFTDVESGRTIVQDVKGFATPVYKLKRKLMLALYGIEISEV